MKIFWVIIVCIGLRLINLDQSLWLDEAISASTAKNYSYAEIVTIFAPGDFHPPLYYLMLKAWTSIFGYSEMSLRMPSVIFSLVTVYIIYLLGGLWPAILTGVNPLLLYYSQEARMYSMITMLLILAVYYFSKKKYFWFNVLAFLCFLTFYGSIFFLATLAIYLLYKKRYRELVISNIGTLLAIMVLLPLLKIQMQNSQEMLLTVKNWSLVLGKANIKNLLLIPIKFSSGRISFFPKILYYFVSGIWTIYVFKPLVLRTLPLRKGSFNRTSFFKFMFWISLLIGTIFSLFTPMLQYFRFLYLVPILMMIIGKNKPVALGFLGFSLVYLLSPVMWREDWQELSKNLDNKVYMIESFSDPIKYYRPDIKIYDIRNMKYESDKNVTVIPYGEAIHGVDHRQILESQGYKMIKENIFREVKSEIWQYSL